MFQPSPATKAAFDALITGIDPERSAPAKACRRLWLLLRHAFVSWLATVVLAMVPAFAVAIASQDTPRWASEWLCIGRALLLWLPVAAALGFFVAAVIVAVRTLKALPATTMASVTATLSDPRKAILPSRTG